MLKIIGFFFKFTFLTILILILGQTIQIQGATISDHVKSALHSIEKGGTTIGDIQRKASELVKNANAAGIADPARNPASQISADTVEKLNEATRKEKAALDQLIKETP